MNSRVFTLRVKIDLKFQESKDFFLHRNFSEAKRPFKLELCFLKLETLDEVKEPLHILLFYIAFLSLFYT